MVRLWKRRVARGETKVVGLYRADSERQLDGLLVEPLGSHRARRPGADVWRRLDPAVLVRLHPDEMS